MLTREELEALARHFLDAWNSQEVETVLSCYTDDLVYRDPNTRGSGIGQAPDPARDERDHRGHRQGTHGRGEPRRRRGDDLGCH